MSYVSTPCETSTTSTARQVNEAKRLTSKMSHRLMTIGATTHAQLPLDVRECGQSDSIWRQPSGTHRWLRERVLRKLGAHKDCCLEIVDADGTHLIGLRSGVNSPQATIEVLDPRAYRHFVFGGALGAAEAFLRGYWRSPSLVMAMRAIARQVQSLEELNRGAPILHRPVQACRNWMRRNSRRGSRKNISAHYDLSNDFFALMLDDTMTYSSGIFQSPRDTMYDASIEKYDRICRNLALTPEHHVLEVGCGWGGFAIHAARNYGCRVSATTISTEQFEFAQQRIREQGLEDRIELLKRDYRDLDGQYDKLVSIEMIEAVGEKYLDGYFAKCSSLLKDDGAMMLQAITIPDDRFDRYRNSVDYIQRYVFPGGFLPSVSAIGKSLRRATNFRVAACDDFGLHYAETLARWRVQFWNRIEEVRRLGFDDRFIRAWDYYLCYCEAGFRERQIGVSHWHFLKPFNRCEKAGLPFPVTADQ